jgi:hypothetical protein
MIAHSGSPTLFGSFVVTTSGVVLLRFPLVCAVHAVGVLIAVCEHGYAHFACLATPIAVHPLTALWVSVFATVVAYVAERAQRIEFWVHKRMPAIRHGGTGSSGVASAASTVARASRYAKRRRSMSMSMSLHAPSAYDSVDRSFMEFDKSEVLRCRRVRVCVSVPVCVCVLLCDRWHVSHSSCGCYTRGS